MPTLAAADSITPQGAVDDAYDILAGQVFVVEAVDVLENDSLCLTV